MRTPFASIGGILLMALAITSEVCGVPPRLLAASDAAWVGQGTFVAASPSGERVALFQVVARDEGVALGKLEIRSTRNGSVIGTGGNELAGYPIARWLGEGHLAYAEQLGQSIFKWSESKKGPDEILYRCEEESRIGSFDISPDGRWWVIQINRFREGRSEVLLLPSEAGAPIRLTQFAPIFSEQVDYGSGASYRVGLAWSNDSKNIAIRTLGGEIVVVGTSMPGPPPRSPNATKQMCVLKSGISGELRLGGWQKDLMVLSNTCLTYYEGNRLVQVSLSTRKVTTLGFRAFDCSSLAIEKNAILIGLLADKNRDCESRSQVHFVKQGKFLREQRPAIALPGIVRWHCGKAIITEFCSASSSRVAYYPDALDECP